MKCLRKSFVERIVCDAMEGRLTTRQAAAKLGCTRQYLNSSRKDIWRPAEKHYCVDPSFKTVALSWVSLDLSHSLENVV